MKKILLLFFLMTISLGYSQASLLGFETTETGGVVLNTFGGMSAPAFETGTGSNTSRVMRITGNTGAAEPWQGTEFTLTNSVNLTTNKTLTIDVRATEAITFLVKVLRPPYNTSVNAAAAVTHNGDGTWQTLSFTFNTALDNQQANPTGTFDRFVIHAYWEVGRTQFFTPTVTPRPARTFWVDNIRDPSSLPFPTLGALTIPGSNPKLSTDGPFVMTNPTSDSSGAWTYSSSPAGVVTFSGNTATIVGTGTTTITATQAAVPGVFVAGTRTASLTVNLPPPPTPAPTPPARNAWDVVSLYSGAYAPTAGATWQAGVDVPIAGDNARFFNGFTLARLAFGARSIVGMTTLHIDVYTVNQNQLWFEINGNRRVVSSIPLNGWASFDIPLSDYVGLNLGNVSFFDLNNPTGAAAPVKVVYLDNIYFYRPATDQPPTIGALTVPSPQLVGNAPFTITNPTSNSSGAWSYSASPAGIVTIAGNTVTIVSGGTATITATQAAVPGVFGAASTTANLVVNFPPPGPSPIPPARDPGTVVSLYTGTPTTYANVRPAVQAGWSAGSTNSNFNFANGDNTCIQVNNLGFFGLVTGSTNFSVEGMNFLHVDIFLNTPMTSMILNLLAPSDRNFTIGPLVAGWNSLDIPLSSYGTGFANINGIKFEQSGGTPRQIYIDNVYFYAGTANPIVSNFSLPTVNPGAPTFTITAPTSNSAGAWSYTSSNNAVGTIVNGNQIQVGVSGSATITATQAANGNFNSATISATFNVLATPTLGAFTVGPRVTGDAPFTLTAPTSDSNGAFTYTILPAGIASISGNTVTILAPGTATITATQAADGLFNSATTTAQLVVSLGTAAPTPPARNAWDVVSLYSNSYTPTAGATWQAGTNVDIAGNNTRLFNGFTLARLAFAPTSVAAMTTLHIDVYTVNQNELWFEVQGNRRVQSSIPLNGWVSFDIPLSVFTGLNLANISFFDLNNPTGAAAPVKVVYLDNIYFYRPATDQPPSIGALTLPSPQVLGNAPFTITNPTSDSSGAWTYSANPTGVVTISGNTVTIVGGGTTTITATQAAIPGVFGPASTSAQLVVNFPEPGPSPALPAREAARVISLFTGSPAQYANAPNYNLGQAFWSEGGGRVLTTVPNGNNTALRIDGLGFMGLIDIGNPPPTNRERRINLVGTGMSHLNIDIYLDTPRPNLFVVLLAPGDRLHNTGPLTAGWNRIRVPLTAFPGALNDIYGVKLEQNYASPFRLFVDNIYFSNDLFTFYADNDGDGFGNLAVSTLAETAPTGFVSNSTDCDDNDNTVWRTGNFYIDVDADGYTLDLPLIPLCYGASFNPFYSLTSLGIDCNDNNAAINPGAAEICFNNIDDNCDGNLSEGCAPVVVNMATANNTVLPSFATGVAAQAYSFAGATTATYRFTIVN
ncbi:putative metal-binding motif-containing protein, partial [Flavobacterium sp. j3]